MTTDSRCAAEGRVTPATVVDHIVPVTGADDPSFFRPEGQQAMCDQCHQAKRQREAMASSS
jgi:5-methylcytosine-specific restriction protein A